LASEDLLPSKGCPSAGDLFVWADVDQRTLETGEGILEGLAPSCNGISVHSLNADVDPLFHPVKAKVCAFDREKTEAAILGRIGDRFAAVEQAAGSDLQALQNVLGCCGAEPCKRFGKPAPRRLQDLGSDLLWKEPADPKKQNEAFSLEGTLGIASTAAEVFLLEYASAFQGEKWGFGRIDEAGMLRLGRLHTLLFETLDRTPYVAPREGSELLNPGAAILEGSWPRLPEMPKSAKAGFLGGPATNIGTLRAMLGVSWQHPDSQANDTPPAGALVFELRRGSDRRNRVFVSYLAQSPRQMALKAALDLDHPPRRSSLFLPACSSSSAGYPCSLDSFERLVDRAVDSQCLRRGGRW